MNEAHSARGRSDVPGSRVCGNDDVREGGHCIDVLSASASRTRDLGAALGRLLRGGELIALTGPLGAGKTCFVQGLARGLDVPAEEPVTSPTFVLVRVHEGRLRLHHVDAYRLRDAAELIDVGILEARDAPGAVVAIEWAERASEIIPPDAIRVDLDHGADPQSRRVRLSLPFEAPRIAALRRAWGEE